MATQYIPNADNAAEPTEQRPAGSAALELRRIKELRQRTLRFPEDPSTVNAVLPVIASRADRLVGFDSSGGVVTPVSVSELNSALSELAQLARTKLGANISWSAEDGSGPTPPPVEQYLRFSTVSTSEWVYVTPTGLTFSVGPNASEVWHKATGMATRTATATAAYFEVQISSFGAAVGAMAIGIAPQGTSTASGVGGANNAGDGGRLQYFGDGQIRANGVYSNYSDTYTDNDVIGCSIQAVGGNTQVKFYHDGNDLGVAFTVPGVNTVWEPHVCVFGTAAAHSYTLTNGTYLPAGAQLWAPLFTVPPF